MDHEAYENEMIEAVNQHGDAAPDQVITSKQNRVINKKDVRAVGRGIRRTILALLTAATLAASALGFYTVSIMCGYMAVLLFFASVLGMVVTVVLLYAQGIIRTESNGESK